jgi:glycosyltransferase involved in cell wall biosynthesis
MNILIFNWQDVANPLAGGAEVHMQEIFSRIAGMGHTVTLFCSSFPGASPDDSINGIHVQREGGRYLFNFRVPWKYLTHFRRQHFDAVIDDMNKIPFYTPLYVRRPLVVIVHHLFGKSIFLESPFLVALYVYIAEKIGYWLCKIKNIPMVVVSPSTQQELLSMGFSPERISIVQNCVDHSVHTPNELERSSTPLISYFGRLKKYKSIDHVLYAFCEVIKEIPETKLLIIGEGDYRATLEKLTKKLSIESSVQFTGFVDEQTKVSLLRKSWFVVNPSSKEGWGLTVIEANACGTPVIASNVPGLRDAIQDNVTGLLYEYGNVVHLKEQMLLLLRDSSLRRSLASAAHQWSLTFDWSASAKKMIEVIQHTIHNKRV